MPAGYRDDLAQIHDAGFGELARNAAQALVQALADAGIAGGLVVELGCGSGIGARLLRDAGFDVLGIDLSAPLVEIARRRVPDATFRVASFANVELPRCVAVTAIGEVLGYRFDESNSSTVRATLFRRIRDALVPGGLLLFDMPGPDRAPAAGPTRSFIEGDGWAVLVETHADAQRSELTRRIASFTRDGALYRRDTETHRLQLEAPQHVLAALHGAGLDARMLDRYGSFALFPGLHGFIATRPR